MQLFDVFYTFPVELLLAVLLFCRRVRWRPPYARLLVLPVVALVTGFAYAPLVRPFDGYAEMFPWIFRMIAFFAVCAGLFVVALRWCAVMRWIEALVTVAAGYAVQHIAFDVSRLVHMAVWPDARTTIGLDYLLFVAVTYAPVYVAAYWLFGRRMTIDGEKARNGLAWVMIGIGVIALFIVFNLAFVQNRGPETRVTGYVYDIVCVLLALSVMMLVSANDHLRDDLVLIRETDRLRERHYELAKENIELINIKCHDIRKAVASLYADGAGRPSPGSIREVEDSIRIYDSIFHTGNESLDALLTEKSLYCSGNGIMFTCSVDGRRLGFIERSDLYALFGNMLDNAVESVLHVTDPDKRVIDLTVSVNGGLLLIDEHNFYAPDRQPRFRDGLPVTTKDDPRYHGFGVRSIDRQVHRYGGEMTISAEHELFSMSIVIPLPDGSDGSGADAPSGSVSA
ncbi:MAG TPA: ATP-binding protein [Candidatus Merdibacter merdigallinarum]|nr:ATP-binding protein [Candidatus Merdibacter merdigallinarum]